MDNAERVAFLQQAYRRFNRHQIDGLLHMMTDDVEWPDVANATVLHGPEAIRPYWEGQFAVATPEVVPTEFIEVGDDLVVGTRQQVYDLDGELVAPPEVVYHRFSFEGDLVRRMVVHTDRAAALGAD